MKMFFVSVRKRECVTMEANAKIRLDMPPEWFCFCMWSVRKYKMKIRGPIINAPLSSLKSYRKLNQGQAKMTEAGQLFLGHYARMECPHVRYLVLGYCWNRHRHVGKKTRDWGRTPVDVERYCRVYWWRYRSFSLLNQSLGQVLLGYRAHPRTKLCVRRTSYMKQSTYKALAIISRSWVLHGIQECSLDVR